jgi:hypothetical protein
MVCVLRDNRVTHYGRPITEPRRGERLSEPSRRRNAARQYLRSRYFIKGPIPLKWLEKAAGCGGKAAVVAYLLWFKWGMEGPKPFTVSGELLSRFGVGWKAAYRAYVMLEKAGLLEVDRGNGRLPRLKVLNAPTT